MSFRCFFSRWANFQHPTLRAGRCDAPSMVRMPVMMRWPMEFVRQIPARQLLRLLLMMADGSLQSILLQFLLTSGSILSYWAGTSVCMLNCKLTMSVASVQNPTSTRGVFQAWTGKVEVCKEKQWHLYETVERLMVLDDSCRFPVHVWASQP